MFSMGQVSQPLTAAGADQEINLIKDRMNYKKTIIS